jgi:hypothetical protein
MIRIFILWISPILTCGLLQQQLIFEAFDCSEPVNLTSIVVENKKLCEGEIDSVKSIEEDVEYVLLQKAIYWRQESQRCRQKVTTIAHYCGNADHQVSYTMFFFKHPMF